MIRIREFSKDFTKFGFGLSCRNLDIEPASTGMIYGATGTGKTLFSKVAAGVIKGYSGSFEMCSAEASRIPRKKVGYVPFSNILYETMSVKEMIIFLLSRYGIPKDAVGPKLAWFDPYCGMSRFADRRISSLSSGQLQWVKLLAGVIHSPSVLIIDELFNGIGESSAELTGIFLNDLNRKGVTVLLTTSFPLLVQGDDIKKYLIENGAVT